METKERIGTIREGLENLGERTKKIAAGALVVCSAFASTGCAEEAKTPREAGFAVTCSDQNGANYAPEIVSVRKINPDGGKAARRTEVGCPVGTDMSVREINPTSNSSLDSDNQKDPATAYLVTVAADCPVSLDGDSIVDWTRDGRHDEAGRETFVTTLRRGCDITKATVSK